MIGLNPKQLINYWNKVLFTTDCWEWTASKNRGEYGSFGLNGKVVRSHRISYELFKGDIPEGLQLDHLCRNRSCVNPNHLEPVTNQENSKRGLTGQHHNHARGVEHYQSKKTHCPKGHEYNEPNIHWYKNRRRCKECVKIHQTRFEVKEQRKINQKEWRSRPEVKEHHRKYLREWRRRKRIEK